MARKALKLTYQQALDALRSHAFDVAPYAAAPGSMLVSKQGVAAVLAPAKGSDGSVTYVVHPGVLVRGEVARLLDRGYQKFIRTSQYELPATAGQLQAIHAFSEELKELTGGIDLYNESLGTTSDLYQYDRLKGREADQSKAARPWELAGGH